MIRTTNGNLTLVLGKRQLVLAVGLLMVLMWMFSVGTSVVGRFAFPTSVAAATPGEPVILVDSPLLEAADSVAAPAVEAPEAVAHAVHSHPLDEPPSATYFLNPQPGRLFLQVAAVNADLASVYAGYLTGREIPAFVSSSADADTTWVMVGPVRDGEHLAELQTDLAAAGFELN